MHKELNGYMTVEAAFVMPIVLFLYILIILCGFFLYNRCVISQDASLLTLRGSRFTDAEENYGEVIYGNRKEESHSSQYIESRLAYKLAFYPFYRLEEKEITLAEQDTSIMLIGYKGTLKIRKSTERLNIIEIVERTGKK